MRQMIQFRNRILRGLRSIRWRLPLSYAGIALVAALVLGAVLITILNDFYTEQERLYLENNARYVSRIIARAQDAGLTIEQIEPQIGGMAAFSGARIELVDNSGTVVLDSGQPQNYFVFGLPRPAFFQFLLPTSEEDAIARVMLEPTKSAPPPATILHLDEQGDLTGISRFTLSRGAGNALDTPDDNMLASGTYIGDTIAVTRTDEDITVQVPFVGIREDARLTNGAVRFSSAYSVGREIMNSVIRGWLIAGTVAVLLAALVGWIVSLNITRPVLELNRITATMASGDLSARLKTMRSDEIGTLSKSFNRMADQVQSTVDALRRFVADAAHEIHTPLTALRTNLELMLESVSETEHVTGRENAELRRALAQVERLQVLADDLLDLSRLESHVETAPYQPVDIESVIRELCEVYASRAEQSGIEFELHLAPVVSAVTVNASPAQLRRLVMNLLDNALKFTPEGGGIRVLVERNGCDVCIQVCDTGIGIPPEDLPYLFNRFRRGKNTANYAGSGLGLAIVKAIADGHGGHVRAQSDRRGTVFTALLPAS